MKRMVFAALLAASMTLAAQQPPQQPPPNAQQVELQKQAELVQAQTQLLYEKLHGLQEFQDYLAAMQKMQTLQQQYIAAGTKAKAEAAKPAAKAEPAAKQPTQ